MLRHIIPVKNAVRMNIPVIGKKSKVKSRLVLSFMVSPFEQIGNLGILDSELQLFF